MEDFNSGFDGRLNGGFDRWKISTADSMEDFNSEFNGRLNGAFDGRFQRRIRWNISTVNSMED
ncbi:hypothetical protein BDBG_16712 [Blastomyces gilchristii SLH14081]|uniref:Uncharacterized protein n=1 Tax=Blastomyces gilchristii (strain SLH14081) TaxID=559298 RepID=A0A179UFK7_BLAGS|nr:uncharacterized protein BDBG_16712 [Blastomyces gilchristii SLH14081]OAT06825.1 hypothetical protein BDBG_16712 [Blastomyces gilchristii SLH14081]